MKTFFVIFMADSLRYIADARAACDRMQQLIETKSILKHNVDNLQRPTWLEVYFKGRRYRPQFVRLESFRSGKPALVSARKVEGTESKEIHPQAVLEKVSCFWSQTSERPALQNVSLRATCGQLVGITGPVGCGKTSLLMSILGELPVFSGRISCTGQTAYVSQTPWVFSGTMRENIVFGMQFTEEKYKKVIEVCDLGKDIQRFPKGDLTEIGQRGVILSGGQRARVSLARAIYSDADIYLLDDPLSAVDAKVGKHLFERCIKEFLAGRVRILATHQLQFLKQADNIVLLQNGSVVYQGTYSQMEKESRRRRFSIVSQAKQDPVSETNNDDVISDLSEESLKSVSAKGRRRSSDLSQGLFDTIGETSNDSKIITHRRGESFKSLASNRRRRSSILPVGEKQDPVGEAYNDMITAVGGETFKSVQTVANEDRERVDLKDEEEDRKSGSVKLWLYWKYLRAALPVILIISLALFFVVVQGK